MRTAYIDIETDYVGIFSDQRLFEDHKNHKLTVIGIRIVGPEEDQFIQLVGNEITRKSLITTLKGVKRLVTYNGRSNPDKIRGRIGFDFPVIAAQLGVRLDDQFPHLDLVPICWAKNLYGGLKAVEQALKLSRQLPGRDGKWAQETWRKYVNTGKKEYLDELLAYNREDVFML